MWGTSIGHRNHSHVFFGTFQTAEGSGALKENLDWFQSTHWTSRPRQIVTTIKSVFTMVGKIMYTRVDNLILFSISRKNTSTKFAGFHQIYYYWISHYVKKIDVKMLGFCVEHCINPHEVTVCITSLVKVESCEKLHITE